MQYPDFLALADLGQSLTVFISLSAYIPQWILLYRKKSSEECSLRAWMLWFGSSSLGFFYAISQHVAHGTAAALVFSSSSNLIFLSVTILMIMHYRRVRPFEEQEPTFPEPVLANC